MLEAVIVVVVVLIVLVAALLVYAATKPNSFRVQRSANISAPPAKVFALINDFHRWLDWSPWEKLDPALKRTFSGAPAGQGAVYEWEGSKKVGQGRMEIMESAPATRVAIKLDFIKPFEAHNTAEFTLQPQGNDTNVTWAMFGRQPFMIKLMSTFFSMEKMIGKEFETGLANMKNIAEK